jgi:hypothetical protein
VVVPDWHHHHHHHYHPEPRAGIILNLGGH